MARTWSHMFSAALGPGTVGTPSKPETFETVRTHQTLELQNLRNRSRFPNLGTRRNPEPPKPSKPRQLSKPGVRNLWNLEPVRTRRNLEPFSEPRNLSEPIETWNHLLLEPIKTWNRFPEPGSFPELPQLAQNTAKSILCKDPIAFCCWGTKQPGALFFIAKKNSIIFPDMCWIRVSLVWIHWMISWSESSWNIFGKCVENHRDLKYQLTV